MPKRTLQRSLDAANGDGSDPKISILPGSMFEMSNDVDAIRGSSLPDKYEIHDGNLSNGMIARMPVDRTAECYNTNHRKRGKCLVFNHERFESGFSNRMGTHVDASRIVTTFTKLGFDVVVHNDLPHFQVMEAIENLSSEDHSDNDCVCIFVLTHGLNHDFLMARDAGYSSDKIWKSFTAETCPTLAGKPKLFFFEASRGEKSDDGVTLVPHPDSFSDSKTVDQLNAGVRSISFSDHIQPSLSTSSYTLPAASDFLIGYSCAKGYSSWRNCLKGSWYIQSLCDVLDEFADSADLLKMLTITARRVATDFQSDCSEDPQSGGKKQMPLTSSTLTRDLYFTRKIVNN